MKALGEGNGKGMSPVKIREQAKRLASKTVKEQMKTFQSFAVMADWEKRWTTMDPDYEIRQLRVFQQLVRGGLIYRKHKPVYWSISSQTALAEAELEYKDNHESTAAYIKYPILDWSSLKGLNLQGPLYAAIWTTTPWTLPANKAIAVDKDLVYCVLQLENYGLIVAKSRVEELSKFLPPAQIAQEVTGSQLAGLQYHNRLQGQYAAPQPILHADFVTADSGTGLVHMAPGHGQEDYDACSRLGIEAFAPVTDEGYFTAEAFPEDPVRLTSAPSILEGGSKAVLDILAADVLGTHNLHHKYPYDWRTKKPVVSRATAQWFADVGSIKADALEALEAVQFVPETGKTRLESFIKGRSEWCISRQRAWGVPIPALYDTAGNAAMTADSIEHIISVMQQRGSQAWFSDDLHDPAWVSPCLQGEYQRGTDTMDVWFDSGSSWAETAEQADVYLEGSDQHRGWFQSSLLTYVASRNSSNPNSAMPAQSSALFNREAKSAPFRTLITHGFTLDDQGKKMSKSLGNTISPSQVMDGTLLPPVKTKGKGPPTADALGPDALRLWAASCVFTSDMLIGASVLQPVHSALIKYRTMLKMLTGSLHESSRSAPLTKLDHIALIQLQDTMKSVFSSFENFEFHRGTQIINRWVANELSAFYLESLKDRLYCGDGGGIIEPIFIGLLRMLAPITPVLVEEAWDHRPQWMIEDRYVKIRNGQAKLPFTYH
jgi:isoleucyl-tRNA synthetase